MFVPCLTPEDSLVAGYVASPYLAGFFGPAADDGDGRLVAVAPDRNHVAFLFALGAGDHSSLRSFDKAGLGAEFSAIELDYLCGGIGGLEDVSAHGAIGRGKLEISLLALGVGIERHPHFRLAHLFLRAHGHVSHRGSNVESIGRTGIDLNRTSNPPHSKQN